MARKDPQHATPCHKENRSKKDFYRTFTDAYPACKQYRNHKKDPTGKRDQMCHLISDEIRQLRKIGQDACKINRKSYKEATQPIRSLQSTSSHIDSLPGNNVFQIPTCNLAVGKLARSVKSISGHSLKLFLREKKDFLQQGRQFFLVSSLA